MLLKWKNKRVIQAFTLLASILIIGCGSGGGESGGPGAGGPGGLFGPGGCASIYGPIGFQSVPGTNIYIDSASIVAGQLMAPWYGSTSWGQVNVGGGGAGGQLYASGINGQITMNYSFSGGGPYGSPGGVGTHSVNGSITLSGAAINFLESQFGFTGGSFNPGVPTSGICINDIGMDLGYSISSGTVFGNVYLYVNGAGVSLAF